MPSLPSPLWPASLHHLALESPEPGRLSDLSRHGPPDAMRTLPHGRRGSRRTRPAHRHRARLRGGRPPRRVRSGRSCRVAELEARFAGRGVATEVAGSPFLEAGSFRVSAPDGVTLLFGAPVNPPPPRRDAGGLSGRLQHAVFRSPEPEPLLSFLVDEAGFVLSDRVEDEDHTLSAGFVRSDPEHHSFAAFRASRPAFDHYALEAEGWNDLRDWADRFSALRIPIWWGAGTPRPRKQPLPHDPGPGRKPDRDLGRDGAHGPRRPAPGVAPGGADPQPLGNRLDADLTPEPPAGVRPPRFGLMPGAGFEPARPKPADFKSAASTWFRHPGGALGVRSGAAPAGMEAEVGIEPAYTALQAAA